jgi:flagellar biosynthetic protein FliR
MIHFGAAGLEIEATGFLILFARVGAVLMLLPVFSEDAVPGRIRLMIAIGLTFGLYGLIGGTARAAVDSGMLPMTLIAELLTGLAMGMIVKIMFYAISIAGSMISLHTGLSAAVIFDPSQNSQVPLLSKLVTVAAAVVCMGMHVHHLWIQAIINSYHTFPIGGLPPAGDFLQCAIQATGHAVTLGLALSAPLFVYAIVFNVALGLSARVAPAIQVFFIAQPLNMLLGLSLAIAILGAVITGFAQEMGDWMGHWG